MVRPAQTHEVDAIHDLIQRYAHLGQMLPCDREDIARRIGEFVVYEIEGAILGACSMKIWWGPLVEVRSLAVHPDFLRRGIGTQIINYCIDHAEIQPEVEGIFVLTYAVELFKKLQFNVVPKGALPLKIWEDCMGCPKKLNCDEVAMYRALDPKPLEIPKPSVLSAAEA